MTEIAPEERLDKIANKCLDLLDKRLETRSEQLSAPAEVKAIGEALKALADGIEGYKNAMKKAKSLKVESTEVAVGGHISR